MFWPDCCVQTFFADKYIFLPLQSFIVAKYILTFQTISK